MSHAGVMEGERGGRGEGGREGGREGRWGGRWGGKEEERVSHESWSLCMGRVSLCYNSICRSTKSASTECFGWRLRNCRKETATLTRLASESLESAGS